MADKDTQACANITPHQARGVLSRLHGCPCQAGGSPARPGPQQASCRHVSSPAQPARQQPSSSQARRSPAFPLRQQAHTHLQRLGGGVLQLGCSHPAGGDGAELSILGADGQGQLSREGVGHRMEGLHRGQAPILQVPPDFSLQPAGELKVHHKRAHMPTAAGKALSTGNGALCRSHRTLAFRLHSTCVHLMRNPWAPKQAGARSASPTALLHPAAVDRGDHTCTCSVPCSATGAPSHAECLPLAHTLQAACALHTRAQAASWAALALMHSASCSPGDRLQAEPSHLHVLQAVCRQHASAQPCRLRPPHRANSCGRSCHSHTHCRLCTRLAKASGKSGRSCRARR